MYTEQRIGTGVTATNVSAVPSYNLSYRDQLKALFFSMLSDFRNNIASWKVPRLCLFVLVTATCR
jgi:hypothetical protein